jgi:hypothetical protein
MLQKALELVNTQIKKVQALIERASFMTYSDSLKEIEMGMEIKKSAQEDLDRLYELAYDCRCIYNATPHPINMLDEYTKEHKFTIEPCGKVARMVSSVKDADPIKRDFVIDPNQPVEYYFPVLSIKTIAKAPMDKVIDLPPFEEGVFIIVSAPVFMAFPNRTDLLQVDPIRDRKGQTIGAKGFFCHMPIGENK